MAKAFIKRKSANENNGDVVNALVVRSSDQVMVKVTIAEVQRSIIKQLGVSAAPNGSETVASGSWGVISQQNPFTVNGNISNSNMTVPLGLKGSVSLRAYERHGVTRVLAEPTVTAVSGETAKLTVGGEIAYPSSSTCGSGWGCTIGVAYKPYGITLNITPIVVAEGRILIRMATEVTEIDSSQSVTVASISVPSFRTRKNETSIELPSGGALATAGLLTNASRQAINGLPGLLNLPVLGALFRSRDYQRQETEMLIVVTPYIARSVNPNEIQRPDDGFVDATDPQGWLLGRVNKLYATKSNPQAVENWKGRFGFIQD